MRMRVCVAAMLFAAWPAMAETITPNHLDCRIDDATKSMICPDVVPMGRSAAAPVEPAAAGSVPTTPASGSPEWNAACAAKYKSFDAATGMYKSFTGKSRPCV
jgi:hypothetical protein